MFLDMKKYFVALILALAITSPAEAAAPGFVLSMVPPVPAKILKMTITAYSSTVDQTDSTPYITASGTTVAEGTVATNDLPFGTLVRMSELFGDQLFVVADRMNARFRRRLDVWMPNREKAVGFGVKYTRVEVVES